MRCATRIFAALAAVAAVGYASAASAAQWTTTGAPASSLTLNVYYLTTNLAGGTGALAVDGVADATVAVDGLGDGSLTFNSSQLSVADIANVPLNFTILGTAQMDLTGVGVSITSSGIPVFGNAWDIDSNPPTTLDISLNQGTIYLDNATGVIAGLLTGPPPGTLTYDLTANPQTVSIGDLTGFGINGTASSSLITVDIPTIQIVLDAQFGIIAELTGSINFVPVPEPSTIAMLGMGVIGLVAVGRRRFRKA